MAKLKTTAKQTKPKKVVHDNILGVSLCIECGKTTGRVATIMSPTGNVFCALDCKTKFKNAGMNPSSIESGS